MLSRYPEVSLASRDTSSGQDSKRNNIEDAKKIFEKKGGRPGSLSLAAMRCRWWTISVGFHGVFWSRDCFPACVWGFRGLCRAGVGAGAGTGPPVTLSQVWGGLHRGPTSWSPSPVFLHETQVVSIVVWCTSPMINIFIIKLDYIFPFQIIKFLTRLRTHVPLASPCAWVF